ncbi:MAG: hypothetical protein B6I26_06810 [Desulfobacteraceae bacterium 4572_130]|nr:MAG: hypothetical protein B6I26_06810 [Desulfobacteraceae bacterium 4572_130]
MQRSLKVRFMDCAQYLESKNMTEINHKEINQYLDSLLEKNIPKLFFVFGEEYITRKVFEKILNFLLSGNQKELGYELLEGEKAGVSSIIESISTYSFTSARFVVGVKNVPLFPKPGEKQTLKFSKEDILTLKNFIKTDFPKNHFLILTSLSVDKRKSLFKTIKLAGVAVNCTVPRGSRMADKKEQTAFLRTIMNNILLKRKKQMDMDAFNLLINKTGFEPATFADNIEKLVIFINKQQKITLNDVMAIVKRTKKDAIYELTNAVAKKNADEALFYLKSLLDKEFHILQILAALINQIRKLIIVKSFVETSKQKGTNYWQRNQNYNSFIQKTIPQIIKSDKNLIKKLEQIDNKKPFTDLLIASNPKNTFPIFKLFERSDNFSLNELIQSLINLSELDFKFKSSTGDSIVLIQELIIKMCTI